MLIDHLVYAAPDLPAAVTEVEGRFGVRARASAPVALDRVEVHLGQESELYLTPLAGSCVNVAVLRTGLPRESRSAEELLRGDGFPTVRAAEHLGAGRRVLFNGVEEAGGESAVGHGKVEFT